MSLLNFSLIFSDRGQTEQQLKGHKWVVTGLKTHQSRVVSCSADKTARVWDYPRGICMFTLTGHEYGIRSVDMDERYVVTGSEDNSLRLYDFGRGRELRSS